MSGSVYCSCRSMILLEHLEHWLVKPELTHTGYGNTHALNSSIPRPLHQRRRKKEFFSSLRVGSSYYTQSINIFQIFIRFRSCVVLYIPSSSSDTLFSLVWSNSVYSGLRMEANDLSSLNKMCATLRTNCSV